MHAHHVHSSGGAAAPDPPVGEAPERRGTRRPPVLRNSHERDLRWLRNLVDELEHLGLVEDLGEDRLLLRVTQAQVNDLQGRDRNSGVVSRRCSQLRRLGALERGMPLVVRSACLPPARPLRPVPDDASRSPQQPQHPDSVEPPTLDPRPIATAPEQPVAGLVEALRLCCESAEWGLAGRVADLLENMLAIRAIPPFLPRDHHETRGPRGDDDEFIITPSVCESVPRGNRAVLGTGAARGPRVRPSLRVTGTAALDLDTAPQPGRREPGLGDHDDLDASDDQQPCDTFRLLSTVEPLRDLCRRRGLPDLEDEAVLGRAFRGWDPEAVQSLVDELMQRLEAGAAIHSPFGLLVTLARRGRSAMGSRAATGPAVERTGEGETAGEPGELRRLEELTGWGELDAGPLQEESLAAAPVVRARLSSMRSRLARAAASPQP